MACPSVTRPRMKGSAIHLCFSEGRVSTSQCVAISPGAFLTAIPQACGDRIMTPSSTACPPIRASSEALSSAGSTCNTRKELKILRSLFIVQFLMVSDLGNGTNVYPREESPLPVQNSMLFLEPRGRIMRADQITQQIQQI